jgi:hypothetical protein
MALSRVLGFMPDMMNSHALAVDSAAEGLSKIPMKHINCREIATDNKRLMPPGERS